MVAFLLLLPLQGLAAWRWSAPAPSPSSRASSPPSRRRPSPRRIKAQETSLLKQAGPQVPTDVLLKDSLRVLLLAPLMAMGFAVSARRITPPPRPEPVLP